MTLLGDWDVGFDNLGGPFTYADWSDCHPGQLCSGGVIQASQAQTPAQAFIRDPGYPHFGFTNVAKVHIFDGCMVNSIGSPCAGSAEDVRILTAAGSWGTEGDEMFVGWSWRFPSTWAGSLGFGNLIDQNNDEWWLYPSYLTMTMQSTQADRLDMLFQTGHKPSPGAGDFNPTPPNGYKAVEHILGQASSASRPAAEGGGTYPVTPPFTKNVWHDFILHQTFVSQSPGIFQLEHREEGGSWGLLYDNTGLGTASVNRAAHATSFWNDANGNSTGRHAEMGLYRSGASTATEEFWYTGFRRRASVALLKAEWDAISESADERICFPVHRAVY